MSLRTRCGMQCKRQSGSGSKVAEAKVSVAELKVSVAEAELGLAKASCNQAAVAEAKVAVAEAQVAVAEAQVAVAEAKVASAGPGEKGTAMCGLDLAQLAYERALRADTVGPAARHGEAEAGDKRLFDEINANINNVKRMLHSSLSVQILEIDDGDFKTLLDVCSVRIHAVEISPVTTASRLPPFSWDDCPEPNQHDWFLQHLNLIKFNHLVWVLVTSQSFLNTDIHGSIHIKLRGNTDAALVLKGYTGQHIDRHGAVVLVELKKPDNLGQQSVHQAIAQLLCQAVTDLQQAPVVLLTDLVDDWRFFWILERDVCCSKCNCSTAVTLLTRLFSEAEDFADIPALKEQSCVLNVVREAQHLPGARMGVVEEASIHTEQDLDCFDCGNGISAEDILEVKAGNQLCLIAQSTPFWSSMFS